MRQHMLLTVLGTNPRKARYSLEKREVEAPLAPVALFRLLPDGERPELVRALCTAQARKESWPQLEAALGNRCQVEVVDVPDGDTQKDVDDYLKRVAEAVPSDVDLTVDVTHGYRHLSFLTYMAVLYLAALRGVRVRGAYYGLWRPPIRPTPEQPPDRAAPLPDRPSPFLDLRPLLELPRWLHALETLRETGSTIPLANVLRDLRDGPPSQSTRKASNELSRLSEAYLSGLPLELGHQASLLHKSIKPLRKLLQRDHSLPLGGELIDLIAEILESFALSTPASGNAWKRQVALSEAELKRQADIIDSLWRHGNIAASLGLMNEWTVSWVVCRRGRAGEWLDFPTARRGAGNYLDAVAAIGRDCETELTAEQRELGVFWSELRELRNAYAHHGMRPQVVVGDPKIAKQRERIRGFWEKTLRSCPDFSLTLGTSPGGRLLVSPIGRRPGVLFSAMRTCRTGGQTDDPVMCLVICSHETEGHIAEAAIRAGFKGAIVPLRLEDPYGGRPEIERLEMAARRHFIGAQEVIVNVTGGTTLMGLAAEALATAARRLACPVRRFGLIDRRPPDQQDAAPYQCGEPYWIDSQDPGDADKD